MPDLMYDDRLDSLDQGCLLLLRRVSDWWNCLFSFQNLQWKAELHGRMLHRLRIGCTPSPRRSNMPSRGLQPETPPAQPTIRLGMFRTVHPSRRQKGPSGRLARLGRIAVLVSVRRGRRRRHDDDRRRRPVQDAAGLSDGGSFGMHGHETLG